MQKASSKGTSTSSNCNVQTRNCKELQATANWQHAIRKESGGGKEGWRKVKGGEQKGRTGTKEGRKEKATGGKGRERARKVREAFLCELLM